MMTCANRLSNPNHVLAPLLPDKTESHYSLRSRPNDRQLIPKITKLYDSNFIVRMLYKQVYWHSLLICCSFCCLLYSACLSLYMMHSVNKWIWMNEWMNEFVWCKMSSLSKDHHVRRELCTTRAAYRSGRQLKAVKAWNFFWSSLIV